MAQIHEVTSLVTATTVRAINIKSEVGTSIPFDAEKKKEKELCVSLKCLFNAAEPCGLQCSARTRNLSSWAVMFSYLCLCALLLACV